MIPAQLIHRVGGYAAATILFTVAFLGLLGVLAMVRSFSAWFAVLAPVPCIPALACSVILAELYRTRTRR